MIFKRYKTTQFFITDESNVVALYINKKYADNTIEFEHVLAQYFLCLFFHDGIAINQLETTQPLLDKVVAAGKGIVWLQNSELVIDIAGRPTVGIDGNNNCDFGVDLANSIKLKIRDSAGLVGAKAVNDSFSFTVNNSIAIFSNGNYSLEFSQFAIPVTGSDIGALQVNNITGPVDNRIQPVSSFINTTNRILDIEYFSQNSFNAIEQQSLSYFPYPKANLVEGNKFHSNIKHKSANGVLTNILDEKGKQLKIKGDFTSKLSIIEYKVGTKIYTYYRFIPIDDYNYVIQDGPASGNSSVLLGYSGTERINMPNSGTFKFIKREEIKIHPSGETLTKSERSFSSGPSVDTEATYYLDGEKKPLFANAKAANFLETYTSREVSYSPVSVKTFLTGKPIPIIPTLLNKSKKNLLELEGVLAKTRLRESTKESALQNFVDEPTEFVTPQGFLRTGNQLDFIKNDIVKNNKDNDIQIQFHVNGVTITSDFYFSLCKEDVFFVLNAKMIKDQPLVSISVNFVIGGFMVELKEFNKPGDFPALANDTYVIFKFSRHSFKELLNDATKWSNYGVFKPSASEASALIDDITKKIKFPTTEDYEYFNKTIVGDKNWNGVVILNIPIGSENLPPIFTGLAASQQLKSNDGTPDERIPLKTALRFQYVAFPVNKTFIKDDGTIGIDSTSFYGIIDYDLLNKNEPGNPPSEDYKTVSDHFPAQVDKYRFVLTKLLVPFENSGIKNPKSYAFLQVPKLFDNNVEIGLFPLSHPGMPEGDKKTNLIRLEGQHQKNSAGQDEFNFAAQANLKIKFGEGNILESISVSRLAFSYSKGTDQYRFDINAKADISDWKLREFISIEELTFENIGLSFKIDGFKLPSLSFDLSKLLVLPKIKFDGGGFLSSFPIKFSHFQTFKFKKILNGGKPDFEFPNGDFDFFKLPNFQLPSISINDLGSLFSFIFDFDLGTLGDLEALKILKGQLLVGWSFKGGFTLGFKFANSSSKGLHLNLFGALKLDIEEVSFGKFNPKGTVNPADCTAYYLRLNDARLTVMETPIPGENTTFNGIIIYDFKNPGGKIAWLINLIGNNDDLLKLGVGQRMGPPLSSATSTVEAIKAVRKAFTIDLKNTPDCSLSPEQLMYAPERNWLIASEDLAGLISDDLKDMLDLRFIFNDPTLYGLFVGLKNIDFSIDILYKRISDNLGVYSVEIQLPASIRSYDTGAAYFRLPNIGIDIYTNGDWKVDIGFPHGDNWYRSGFLQLRTVPPFVGWFGFYVMKSKIASLTLFRGFIDDAYSSENLTIIQAGFAMRVGLGAYIDGGVFYIGASISVYGILEGAFAFKKEKGLATFFPNHFAVFGRIGAIAEVVVYVDFFIIQASANFRLQVEFGLLLVYLSEPGSVINPTKPNQGTGIQPVTVYVEGRVVIRLEVKIGCIKFHLSFEASVRFEYTIGGGGSSRNLALQRTSLLQDFTRENQTFDIQINGIQDIPMAYMPSYSKVNEGDGEKLLLIHTFFIPFFGKAGSKDFTKFNIIKTKILKPFFEDLIAGLRTNGVPQPDSYETLRSILLNVESFPYKVTISIPNYRPTFIDGINSETKDEIEKILKNHFLFTETGDFQPCDAGGSCKPIVDTYNDSLRILQAPISTKITVVDKDNAPLFSADAGFKIGIENLVKDEAGTSSTIISDISAVLRDDDDLKYMQSFYDDYKTQFVERQKDNRLHAFAGIPKDIRQHVIIPEYFKLIALMSLEAFYDTVNRKQKNGEKDNPIISNIDTSGNFYYKYQSTEPEQANPWDPNALMDRIVGQVNYFYNSGLRIPDKADSKTTTSLFEVLNQREKITPLTGGDFKNVKISIDSFKITNDVFGETDAAKEANIAGPTGMWKYIEGFGDAAFLENLKKEFGPDHFTFVKPFEMIPVTLALQTGKLDVGSPAQSKFFELPKKLAQHAKAGSHYSFAANYADSDHQDSNGRDIIQYSTNPAVGNPQVKLDLKACLNIEVKVKKQKDTGRILEISNVQVDDLNLAYAFRNTIGEDGKLIDLINCYFKPVEPDPKKPVTLTSLLTKRVTILKTNLSPRTSPPIISIEANFQPALFDADQRKYLADSDDADKLNFSDILWEALTTNNGGYFLVFDKDLPDIGDAENTIILSFEAASLENGIPKYFNCLKLNNKTEYKEIFETGLDDKKHYLYIDKIQLDNKDVREYHPTIPAHTFSFNIARDRTKNPSKNTSHYLPLEFTLNNKNGTTILDREKVLPIMPTTPDGNENFLRYNHISPLVTKNSSSHHPNDTRNIYNRYLAIGNEYNLKYGLRDTYGFRTAAENNAINTVSYKHFYFDKIVPIESWPFIKFSYWLSPKTTQNKLIFDLQLSYSLLEILDACGIERNANGSYKYPLGEVITDMSDLEKMHDSLLNTQQILSTIAAQLVDSGSEVEISFWNDTASQTAKEVLKKLVLDLENIIDNIFVPDNGKYRMPKEVPPIIFSLEKPGFSTIKMELDIFVRIKRPHDFTLLDAMAGVQFGYDPNDLKDDTIVWDFASSFNSISHIRPENTGTPNKSTIAELNKALRDKTKDLRTGMVNYSLGIASNEETKEKIVFVVNEGKLSQIAVDKGDLDGNKFKEDKCYFGIKPYSNKLWAGDYTFKPTGNTPQTESFSNIDLDKSLKLVLAKIDELLLGNKISPDVNFLDEIKDIYDKLVSSKKAVVEEQLKEKVDWVMRDPTAPLDEIRHQIIRNIRQRVQAVGVLAEENRAIAEDVFNSVRDIYFSRAIMVEEFRSLLLSGLNNFYSYDGIIKTNLKGLEILEAGADSNYTHRLNVGFVFDEASPVNKNYNLQSSKWGFDNKNEWYVFFDQKEGVTDSVSFSIQPEITHIEFDIKNIVDEIEHSTWIQLVAPIRLSDNSGKYQVEKWEKITRSFPEKPVIAKHDAIQKFVTAEDWVIEKVGLWNYELEIFDPYAEGDIIHVDLILQTPSFGLLAEGTNNFNGFIAFWSSAIIKSTKKDALPFDWKAFVNDLFKQFSSRQAFSPTSAAGEIPYFELKKVSGNWTILKLSDDLKGRLKVKANMLGVIIEDFDIFSTTKTVYSVNPMIKVLRNKGVNNPEFWYETESITAATPATPHIRYFTPIKLQNTSNAFENMVFKKLNTLNFKATAKYLVNTDNDFPAEDHYVLPIIPVRQIECKLFEPTSIQTDRLFDVYRNGYAAFSLTVYNGQPAENSDLPIFHSESIVKI